MNRSTDRIRDLPFLICILALFLLVGGCDVINPNSKDVGEPTVTVNIVTNTTGPEDAYDSDGYTVLVGGEKRKDIGANDEISLQLKTGYHEVRLGDVAANCSIQTKFQVLDLQDGTGTEVPPFRVKCHSELLAFAADRENGSEIGTSLPDGTKLSWLTRGDKPALSPDGEEILFEMPEGGIGKIPTEGGQVEEVISSQSAAFIKTPDWGPNGRKIYYLCGVNDKAGVCVADVGEKVDQQSQLLYEYSPFDRVKGRYFHHLRVSPSGKWAVFSVNEYTPNSHSGVSTYKVCLDCEDFAGSSVLVGGKTRNLYPSFSKGDSTVYFVQTPADSSKWKLMRQVRAESAVEKLERSSAPLYSPVIRSGTVVYGDAEENALMAIGAEGQNARAIIRGLVPTYIDRGKPPYI